MISIIFVKAHVHKCTYRRWMGRQGGLALWNKKVGEIYCKDAIARSELAFGFIFQSTPTGPEFEVQDDDSNSNPDLKAQLRCFPLRLLTTVMRRMDKYVLDHFGAKSSRRLPNWERLFPDSIMVYIKRANFFLKCNKPLSFIFQMTASEERVYVIHIPWHTHRMIDAMVEKLIRRVTRHAWGRFSTPEIKSRLRTHPHPRPSSSCVPGIPSDPCHFPHVWRCFWILPKFKTPRFARLSSKNISGWGTQINCSLPFQRTRSWGKSMVPIWTQDRNLHFVLASKRDLMGL